MGVFLHLHNLVEEVEVVEDHPVVEEVEVEVVEDHPVVEEVVVVVEDRLVVEEVEVVEEVVVVVEEVVEEVEAVLVLTIRHITYKSCKTGVLTDPSADTATPWSQTEDLDIFCEIAGGRHPVDRDVE